MTTLFRASVSVADATVRVGSALRIVPVFSAAATDTAAGVRTAITVHYSASQGRYVIRAVTNEAVSEGVEINYPTIARIGLAGIIQAAAPRRIFLTLDDEDGPDAVWMSVDRLTTAKGRILPPALAAEVVRRGASEARMEAIELLYGTAALSNLPPARLIQEELGIPHRTASQWIIDARNAGRLEGMNYHAGRQART